MIYYLVPLEKYFNQSDQVTRVIYLTIDTPRVNVSDTFFLPILQMSCKLSVLFQYSGIREKQRSNAPHDRRRTFLIMIGVSRAKEQVKNWARYENMIELRENMIELRENMIELREHDRAERTWSSWENMIELRDNMIELRENMIELEENMMELEENMMELEDRAKREHDRARRSS